MILKRKIVNINNFIILKKREEKLEILFFYILLNHFLGADRAAAKVLYFGSSLIGFESRLNQNNFLYQKCKAPH